MPRISFTIKIFGVDFMMKKLKKLSFPVQISICVGVCVAVVLLLAAISALITAQDGISDSFLLPLAVFSAGAGCFIGAFLLGRIRKKNGLACGAIFAGCILVLVLLVSLVLKGAQANIFSVKLLIWIFGSAWVSMLACVLGVNAKR